MREMRKGIGKFFWWTVVVLFLVCFVGGITGASPLFLFSIPLLALICVLVDWSKPAGAGKIGIAPAPQQKGEAGPSPAPETGSHPKADDRQPIPAVHSSLADAAHDPYPVRRLNRIRTVIGAIIIIPAILTDLIYQMIYGWGVGLEENGRYWVWNHHPVREIGREEYLQRQELFRLFGMAVIIAVIITMILSFIGAMMSRYYRDRESQTKDESASETRL